MKRWRDGDIVPRILTLALGQFHSTVVLPPRERTPEYPTNGRLDGSQSVYGRYGEEKNLLTLPEFEGRSFGFSTHSPLAILTKEVLKAD
jgi:hypothetical protein